MQNVPERMNDKGTCSPTDTPVARGSSRPVRALFELIDKDGIVRARSHCGLTLAIAARDLMPDQEQDPDRTGKGWDIQVAQSAPQRD